MKMSNLKRLSIRSKIVIIIVRSTGIFQYYITEIQCTAHLKVPKYPNEVMVDPTGVSTELALCRKQRLIRTELLRTQDLECMRQKPAKEAKRSLRQNQSATGSTSSLILDPSYKQSGERPSLLPSKLAL